ncbi:MAG: N-acetylglucosamine-6-phosphate deacetylase [Blastocatellia bacterium]|nr:N-acetylglucosamine-6-phosphate deacetylase [Blastocatellia bacterium]
MKIRGRIGSDESLMDIVVAEGRIAEMRPADLSRPCDLGDAESWISPGWLDIHINGYDGVDFNATGTTSEEIDALTRALRSAGVTAFCPTIITGSDAHIAGCIANLVRAQEESPAFAAANLGIHLEGPFISTEDGPRGAHPREHARRPDWEEFARWQEAARGGIRLVTLSPEWPESSRFIERAVQSGVLVAIGHTAARPEQIAEAVAAGATLSTHLGNGSHAKIDRHPNYIWEQLAADALWASLIVDGHHLPPSVVKSFFRCKGIGRTILITDAIAAAGRPPGRYRLGNVEVEVTPQRRVCLPGTPYLAGSVLEMREAIPKMALFSGASLADALRMASRNPAEFLACEDAHGVLAPGRRADFVLFRWDGCADALDVRATLTGGEITPPSLRAVPGALPA